jgi:hydrogenase maturation protease
MSSAGTLILGWGNPGRLDDGLGPAFAEALETMHLPGVTVDSDYQLQIEDASEVASFERVVFVDADRTGAEPFWMQRIYPSPRDGGWTSFSTHSVTPGAVLTMARELFDAEPEAWLLGIRGYEFSDFGEQLSDRAGRNLDQALEFVSSALREGEIRTSDPVEKPPADPPRL